MYDFISLRDRERKTTSQEFRYSTEKWLFGIYALRLSDRLNSLDQGEYFDPFFNFFDSLDYSFDSQFDANNVAIFSQYNDDLTDRMTFSAGVRAEYRSTTYRDSDGLQASPDEILWGGEVSLRYQLLEELSVFAAASRGYKAGGFNLGAVPENARSFGDESLWAVEVGIRTDLLSDALTVSTSVFHNWRIDQQVRTSFQLTPGDPSSFGFATLNVDEARTFGIESEIQFFPNSHWELYANIGLLGGSFRKIPADVGIDSLLGRANAHAPRYTAAAGVVYRSERGYFARLDATAKDEFYFDVSHDQKSRSFGLLNARIGYAGERWLASLWARNVLDEEYAVRGFFFGNEPPDFPNTLYTRLGDPRQIGVTLERRF